jgi:hypothetical protein
LPPYFGLWTRLAGFRPGELAALLIDRKVVRIVLMRGTVHLVTADDYVETHPKANIVLDMESAVLDRLVGRVIRLGDCTLKVTQAPAQCAGVYAEVVTPGAVSVDDALMVAESE